MSETTIKPDWRVDTITKALAAYLHESYEHEDSDKAAIQRALVADARRATDLLVADARTLARVAEIASSLRAAGLLQQATAIEDALAEAGREVRSG